MSTTKIATIEIRGVEVTLDWSEADSHRAGVATHTVSEADMGEGSAGGPTDGETFTVGGQSFRLGQHDYETNDGEVTCWANIYPVEAE